MKISYQQKREYIFDHKWREWCKVREGVDEKLSMKQSMKCVCGQLATGFHELSCRKFRNKVDRETCKRIWKTIPKCEIEKISEEVSK